MNKINLKGFKDVHTPTCDYINLMKDMSDGVNTFGTTDTYDCASIAPLFAPNAFLANGNKLNNYLSGYLPTYEGNNYLLTPMRRYNSNKKGLKTSYVKYKIVDGNYAYASGVSIDGDDGQDEVDTSSFDNSETAYDKDRFTVILANKDEKSVYKQNVHAEVKGNDYSAIRIYTEDGGEYLDGGDSMEVESGKMLTIKLKANGFMLDSLTVTRNNGDKMSETLLESDDFSHLSTDSDGWFEFHYPMPYSDATFTLNATATPVMVNVRMGDIAHGSGSIKSFDEEQNTYVWIQEVEAQENFALDISFKIEYGYQFNGPVFYNDDTNQQISCSYRKVNSFVDFDNYTNYNYTVWVPGVNLRIEAAFDETLYTASLGTLEHCTGTMGYLQGNAYGIGNVHDTQETSISVSKAIRSVCAIITVEKGYTPVGKTVDSIISVTDAKTGEAVNVKVNLMIDVDEEMRPVYYAMFDMPQRNIVIDVVCEPSLTATLNTESFVYDSNNNPVCHALLQDPLTDVLATVVSLPDYGNFFRCYFYKDEYHDMSHLSIIGADTGMVYYDQDQPKDFTNREEDLNDNTGLVNFEVQQDGSCALAVMFMDGRLKTTPESLILTPTFVRNETPIPPTEAPTEAPIKYSATLSSFDGGTPTFNLGSVTVIRKAEESEEVPFYITAAPDYEVKELTIIGTGGTGITPQKTAEPYEDGENMIHSYSFEMPAEDVVIKGKLGQKETPTEAPTEAPRYFAVPDKTQFIRDSQGTEIAYIELKDPETNNYSKERIWFASDSNTIEGRFIYDDEYCPSHLKVIGKETGTVFYDMDKSEDAYTFVCVTSDLAPFGEDLSVIPTFEKTVQPTEAPTEAPTETPTEAPTQPATEPDPPAHGIRTYEELVEFARLVNEDYANYGNAKVWLENNIIAPADSEWTQGIGSLNDDKPFNGIFDGNGYCIIGLNINNSKYGSLFESVGEKGVIKDLMIFDTHFITEATFAAGIVISNEGTIDHCISGINVLGRTKITLPSGKKINPADYNSVITGTNSAGIALVNSGTITGCRNGSVVRGDYCAGIAALNDGSIYGSTNNGAIGTDTAECLASGGITVHNMGSIASSYNSGKLRCADKISMGYVTVYNSSDTVNNVFFNNVNSIPAIKPDEDTNVQLNDTNKLVENEVMLTQEFVETLAAVTDDSITWVRTKYGNSYFNQGYPIIQGRFLEQNTQYLTKDITISGAMHSSLKASATALDTESEEYQALQAAADGELISAYAVSTTDKNGNFVPAELWTSGGMQITVALDGNDIAPTGSGDKSANRNTIVLIALTDDGEAVRIYPDRIENGKAVFTSVIPSDFAVAKVEAYKLGDADGDGEVDITDATTIQRFDVRMNIAPVTEADLLARADVDGDGEITIIDATMIQRKLAGIIKIFPAEENNG